MVSREGSPLSSVGTAEESDHESIKHESRAQSPSASNLPPSKRRRTGVASWDRHTPLSSAHDETLPPPSPTASISSDTDGDVPNSPSIIGALGNSQDDDYTGQSNDQVTVCRWDGCPAGDLKNMDGLVQHLHFEHIGSRQKRYSCEWTDCSRKGYKVIFYVRSTGPINLTVSLTGSNGVGKIASTDIIASDVSNWTKVETLLEANQLNHNSRLQLTTTRKGVIWLDQVSAMPTDTYKGHGFRSELVEMLADLKPRFIRFPGGCFVEGEWLRNAFRWKETIGPWEERPGHFGDVWMYWTDDGLGYFEFLQLAEDLGALPVWVFNNGISHNDQVDTSVVLPFVQEALDGIEFARGDPTSKWGSIRAAMGHPEPFDLRYVAVGNEDCSKKNYQGNYLKFHRAISSAYPDIQIISNCDGSSGPLDHPADFYDYHVIF